MKPDSTKETITNQDNEKTQAPDATVSTIKQHKLHHQDYQSIKDIEYFRKKMRTALTHVPEYCVMCNKEPWQTNHQVQYLGPTSFRHHLKESFKKSNGQSPNREVLNDMYNRYREIVDSLRRISKKANRPHRIVVSVDVLT